MGRNILKSSLQNASFSMVFQVLFRCITFTLNAFVIRTVGHNVLGIMNVRLLLLESTILFLSKEPFLKSCLTNTKSHNWAQVVNQIWISVPITALLSSFMVYIWLEVLSPVEELYYDQYKWGCYSMALSCIIEQTSQSVVLVAQSFCFVKLKIILETLYILVRTSVFFYLVFLYPEQAIGAFALAQIVSAVLLCLLYYLFFAWYIPNLKKFNKKEDGRYPANTGLFADMTDFPFDSIWNFLPGHMLNKDKPFDKDLCVLTLSFAKQSIVKQVLTEGEKYVMTVSPVMTFTEQSIYDIVNNLGSLAARFIFRPVEENAYFYFTQMIRRNIPVKDQDEILISESAQVLKHLCNVMFSIGIVILVFGQSYSSSLLYLYGGRNLDDSLPVILLKCHCCLVLLLAVNGVSEGFVFATMSNLQLDRYNYVMVLFSIIFLLVSYIFTIILGPSGFILANSLNLLARIIHSLHYIAKMYEDSPHKPLEGLKPSWKFLIALLVSGLFTKMSEVHVLPMSLLYHIIIGAVFFCFTVLVWTMENRDLLQIGYKEYKRKLSLKKE